MKLIVIILNVLVFLGKFFAWPFCVFFSWTFFDFSSNFFTFSFFIFEWSLLLALRNKVFCYYKLVAAHNKKGSIFRHCAFYFLKSFWSDEFNAEQVREMKDCFFDWNVYARLFLSKNDLRFFVILEMHFSVTEELLNWFLCKVFAWPFLRFSFRTFFDFSGDFFYLVLHFWVLSFVLTPNYSLLLE